MRAANTHGRRGFFLPKLWQRAKPTSLADSVVPLAFDPINFSSLLRAQVAALCFRLKATQEHW